MPWRARPWPASWKRSEEKSSALEGMQPILRQVPPRRLALLDAGGLQPELGRADRRDIAARSAADHHQIIALGLAHRFSACCFLALRLPGGARRTSTTARSRSPP